MGDSACRLTGMLRIATCFLVLASLFGCSIAHRPSTASSSAPSTRPLSQQRTQSPASGSQWLRVWSSGEADIAVRADGWVAVERALEQSILPNLHDLTTVYDLFAPDQITRWTESVRAFVGQARNDTTTYGPHLSNVSSLGMSVSYYHHRGAIQWGTLLSTFCGSGTWSNRTAAQLIDLLAKLDSAATLARSITNPPVAIDRSVVRDRADVTCGARVYLGLTDLPIDSVRMLNPRGKHAPIEILTRVIVSAGGIADTASLEFYPPASPSQRRAIIEALPRWQWWTATLHGTSNPVTSGVANRAHVVVRFADPADSADIVQFTTIGRRPTFVALDNGMVEWSSRFQANTHELYLPADVLRWVAEVRTTPQMRRPSELHFPREAHCGGSPWQIYFGGAPGNAWLDSAEAAARRAIAKNATPVVDTSRIYGELEITCPAERREGRSPAIAQDDSIRASLSLRSEALSGFVIDRDGFVEPKSIFVFGDWADADRRRISAAIATLTYLPPRFAGLRVAQRSHYLVHPTARNGPGSRDPAQSVCIGGAAGTRVSTTDPAASARKSDLERIADVVVAGNGREPRAQLTNGAFRVTVLPDGTYSALQWTRASRDTVPLRELLPAKFSARLGTLNTITVDVEVGVRCQ